MKIFHLEISFVWTKISNFFSFDIFHHEKCEISSFFSHKLLISAHFNLGNFVFNSKIETGESNLRL